MTTKKRNLIYEMALEKTREHIIQGLCPCIADAWKGSIWEFHSVNKKTFPEIYLFKPKNTYNGSNWYDPRDYVLREVVLEFCIAMTE